MDFEFVKIVVYVPATHADEIRNVLAESGAGYIGNYDYCSFSVKGIGRFRPQNGATPFIGEIGAVEAVDEERIETVCPKNNLEQVLATVKMAHPYEEPAIDVYPLLQI